MKGAAVFVLLLAALLAVGSCSDAEHQYCKGVGLGGAPVAASEVDAVRAMLDSTDSTYSVGGEGRFGYEIHGHADYTWVEVEPVDGGYAASAACVR
jgi:hypothetical protein